MIINIMILIIVVLIAACYLLYYQVKQRNMWIGKAHRLNDYYKKENISLSEELTNTTKELEKYKQMYKESERVRKKLYQEKLAYEKQR